MADTFDYPRSQNTAIRLLTKFGRTIQVGYSTPGTGPGYEPGPDTWVWNDVVAAVLPANKSLLESFDNQLEAGTLIAEKLRYVIMAPLLVGGAPHPKEPESMMRVIFDNAEWQILGATPLNPAGIPVLYNMGVKRL